MYKIVCVTNKGKLSNEQMLFISAIQKVYGVHCIFQTERKSINQPRYKRYLRVVKKHGLVKGLAVLVNIPFAKILFSLTYNKTSLLLERFVDKDLINSITKVDGGILNSEESVKVLKEIQPDLLFQCGAGIIKRQTFQTARFGMLNLHHGIIPSILGMHSVMWAIREHKMNWIGISLHMIDEGIDTGALIGQARCCIEAGDDLANILYKLDILGVRLLGDGLSFLFEKSNPKLAPDGIVSAYRSSFTVFDTIVYLLRKRSFFMKFKRPEVYSIGEYLKQ